MSPSFGERVPEKSADTCYRHPARQSFVLCQRCTKTICPDCQTQAPVGVICPACLKQGQPKPPSLKRRIVRTVRSDRPIVMQSIIVLCIAAYVLQLLTRGWLTEALLYSPLYNLPPGLPGVQFEPWRMVTAAFVHATPLPFHLMFNMLTLWVFARVIEPALGSLKFLVVYLLCAIAGNIPLLLLGYQSLNRLSASVVGASGAIFGLMGLFLVMQKVIGADVRPLVTLLGINIIIAFLPGSNIAWESHLGGFLCGMLIGIILHKTSQAPKRTAQIIYLSAIAVLFAVVSCCYLIVLPTYAPFS